ncbi:putative APG7-component of the autophagic system [Violaceomyces palustris]|uniref:APG7-component of the autophagic system n=1 Tax=Violaceomyces palustris TaxID=1673888 RepID=A0ACD0NU73_9BASI|nr:putative APG7-component of the autophagic system [Violaceomyces palustris]
MPLAQFSPFGALIHPSFWQELTTLKIDKLQLSDQAVQLLCHYTTGRTVLDRTTGNQVNLGCNLVLDASSLANEDRPGPSYQPCPAIGTLKNFNTIEDFRNADKQAAFNDVTNKIWDSILHSDDPCSDLTRFLVLTFADLKKYRFYYWFGYPALVAKPGWTIDEASHDGHGGAWIPALEVLGERSMNHVSSSLARRKAEEKSCNFFLLRPGRSDPSLLEIGEVIEYESFFEGVQESQRIASFLDPSPSSAAPGWPLRNFLALLSARFGVSRTRILCWKDEIGKSFEPGSLSAKSVVGHLSIAVETGPGHVQSGGKSYQIAAQANDPSLPSSVGWERNAQGKLGPKVADLGPMMDPARLADQAVDLNLKLMKWRIMPDIQLEKIQKTKCLLLGAGTLGCYVARTLMGWGVRHITFVDSSKVSFSNPVRQPLFEFEDCLDGGKPKAQCAADRLKKVYPGINATGHQLNIPMPGHPVPASSTEQVRKDVEKLEQLFDEHDAIYLLMDSRESRWLPSLLGAAKGKLVLNAALGFDTFLVMRHGAPPPKEGGSSDEDQLSKPPEERRLGCYFCNDIVAPADSLTDRTLDQMCTVTRPGLAAIAGASAVELMVSVVQHDKGLDAPAAASPSNQGRARGHGGIEDDDRKGSSAVKDQGCALGSVPHQIRGFLAQFNNMIIVGQAYDRCTACSERVVRAYQDEGFQGCLLRAFNEEGYLEKLTGLDKMYEEAEAMEAALDWEEEEEEEE